MALPEFLAQLVDMFRLQAEDKGIGFVFDAADDLPAAGHTDEQRLRQILINLLSNAIKFTVPRAGDAARALAQPRSPISR